MVLMQVEDSIAASRPDTRAAALFELVVTGLWMFQLLVLQTHHLPSVKLTPLLHVNLPVRCTSCFPCNRCVLQKSLRSRI